MISNKLFQRFAPIDPNVSEQLDMLRGFCTATVLFGHAYLVFLYPVWPIVMLPLYLFGHSCVMAFFALSGFLICKSVSYNIQRNTYFKVRRYATSRLNRILPPFYLGCLVLLLLYFISPYFFASGSRDINIISDTMTQARMALDVKSFVGVLLFINGFITDTPPSNFAFWSLPFEVWFYTLFALFMMPNQRWCTIIGILLLLTLSVLNYTFFLYALIWCCGVIAALLHNHQYQLKRKTLITSFSLIALTLLTLAVVGVFYFPFSFDKQKYLLALYGTLCGISFCYLFYLMSFHRVRFYLPGKQLTPSSYTIYILHFPLLIFAYGIVQPYVYQNLWVLFITTFLIALGIMFIGLFVGRYVEKLKVLH
ncbi:MULTISPECIES: acyltransferase family protein [Providencia]|uniref:acyltransferase family protein n=1 Tax=Providencia TaxID=586 RepID=UPI00090B1D1F|nr:MULTISPECIES: acyltransferase [Providencia]APG52276.1 acyltransferase [Providencia stuartii]AVL41484.1 acyltransferase [Providencia stuartii]EMD1717072.1 acyltransferase [Providencia stuartii]MBG5905619.1 acyltransferase [Providencia stuartii]MBG5907434.1 acyltransferase [Providencia stuartii]